MTNQDWLIEHGACRCGHKYENHVPEFGKCTVCGCIGLTYERTSEEACGEHLSATHLLKVSRYGHTYCEECIAIKLANARGRNG